MCLRYVIKLLLFNPKITYTDHSNSPSKDRTRKRAPLLIFKIDMLQRCIYFKSPDL
jgi:hypothetical protein